MIAHPNTGTTGSGGAGAEGSGWPTGGPRPPASQREQTEPRELNTLSSYVWYCIVIAKTYRDLHVQIFATWNSFKNSVCAKIHTT